MHLRRLLRLLVVCVATVVTGPAWSDRIDAYVVSVEGKWTLQGNPSPLKVGSALSAPTRLTPIGAGTGHRIVVVAARGGAVLLAVDCAQPGLCARPVPLPAPREAMADAAQDSWLRRLMSRIEGQPDRYVATLSRGSGAPHDAVLPVHGGAVELAAALAPLPPGRYGVALQALDCKPSCASLAAIAPIDWAPGGAASVPLSNQRTGLHDLSLRRHEGAGVQPARHARVLLLPEAQAQAAAARFAAWGTRVRAWGDALDDAQRRALMRAALDELAAGPP